MFKQVATPSELRKFEKLYQLQNKGSATILALRVVKRHWDKMIANHNTQIEETTKLTVEEPRTFKVNYRGSSWLEPI